MLATSSVPKSKYSIAVFVVLIAVAPGSALLAKQLSSQEKSQINQQAALLATQPAKLRLKMLASQIRVGAKSQGQITILSANDQPVAAKEDWQCTVLLNFASGKSTSQTVSIRKGESMALFEFSANEAGLTSISVQPPLSGIRQDKTEVIIQPTVKRPQKKIAKGILGQLSFCENDAVSLKRVDPICLRLQTVSVSSAENPYSPDQGPENRAPARSSSPILHILVNDIGGNYFANGTDAAVISAVLESPDFSAAPTDIHIWLSLTNGSLDPPQPLQITKGSFSAQTRLTSTWPADIHVNFVSSTPAYQALGDTDFIAHFVPAGVGLVGPDKLSVVDNTPVMIVFFDAQRNPVAPGKNWSVTLRSKESKLRFAPQSFQVQPDSPTGSAVLFPVSFGNDTIEAVIANYSPQPLSVVVTGWLVLGLCLGGGLAGGLAAYDKFKGSLLWRILLGILGGGVLCWLYVYLALPNVDINIAHNTFSVFFVALIGGYMGTTVLDFAAKRWGLSS